MNTARSFVNALREILKSKPYHKITVQDLCDEAHLSKRTFYKLYTHKDAVVEGMVREDFIDPSETMRSIVALEEFKSAPSILIEQTYKKVLSNKEQYRNLLATAILSLTS